MSKTVIICFTVAFVVAVVAFVVLSLLRIDTASLGSFLVFIVANSVPTIATYVKLHHVNNKVDTVVEHTNGPLTETVELVREIAEKMDGAD